MANVAYQGGKCVLSVWMSKCLSWTLLLTNIACLINTKLVYGFSQIEMDFGLVLSLSLKTDVSFSLHDNSNFDVLRLANGIEAVVVGLLPLVKIDAEMETLLTI